MIIKENFTTEPDENGYFGEYGGIFLPPQLQEVMDSIYDSYMQIRDDNDFKRELNDLLANYVGRPSLIYHAKNLTGKGGQIYLKREDLNHTSAHKINHCLGEALLARKMGKKKLIIFILKKNIPHNPSQVKY